MWKGVTNQAAWGTDAGKAVLSQYKINMYAGTFMNFPAQAVLSYTYLYNSDQGAFALGANNVIDRDGEFTSGIYGWFDSLEEKRDQLSFLDVMYFLLNYQKAKKPSDQKPTPTIVPAQKSPAPQMSSATEQPSVKKQKKGRKPARVVGVSVSKKKNRLRMSWKKRQSVAGYQIQYTLKKEIYQKEKDDEFTLSYSSYSWIKKE